MRYLKNFNNRELKDDLIDICLELTDVGYKIDFDIDYSGLDISSLKIFKSLDKEFNYYDVKDVVDRIENYLGSKFVGVSVKVPVYGVYQWEHLYKDCKTKGVKINWMFGR